MHMKVALYIVIRQLAVIIASVARCVKLVAPDQLLLSGSVYVVIC